LILYNPFWAKATIWRFKRNQEPAIPSAGVTAGSLQRSKKHVIQWNPVVLRILSWREKREEAKREEFKEKTTKQPLRQRQVSW
jgi:hypothetical protein